MPDDLRERLELRAGHLEALAVSPRTLAPDGVGTVTAGYLGLREALAALDAKDAEIGRLTEALEEARSGLQIAAGWARTKPNSENARAKIRSGLDAIRSALRNNPHQALEPKP